MERDEPVSLPTVAVPVPGPIKPPAFSVIAPTVPVPMRVPPLFTVVAPAVPVALRVPPLAMVMALEVELPEMVSVPALMVVVPL